MFVKKLKLAAILFLALAGSVGLALVVRGLSRADAGGPVEQPTAQEKPKLGAVADAKPRIDVSKPIRSLPGHTDRLTSVAFSPDGRWIATAAWDGTARLWDAQSGKEMRCLNVPAPRDYHPAHLSRILFSPDNEFIIVAQQAAPDEAGVIIWKRRTGERAHELLGGAGCVALSPDGKHIACGGWDVGLTAIRLYELATGKLVREIHSRYSRVVSLTYSRDGNTLFAQVGIPRPPLKNGLGRLGMDPIQARAWDVATGKERRTGLEHDGVWNGELLVFSPDGRTLAMGTSLWETATGGGRAQLIGHKNLECAVAFSPDGRTLASASMDGTVRLWDLLSGKEVGRFGKLVEPFKGGWVLTVAFSPDGRSLVWGGLDKTAHICDVGSITGRRRDTLERSPAELERDWQDLAKDSASAYAAMGRLALSPEGAVALLGKHLQSIKPVDTKRIERVITDLDSEQFRVRELATKELLALGENGVPSLRRALAGNTSLEMKRRLEALLDRLEGASLSVETVRQIRAVEVLESIGNMEARRLLEKLAAGQPEARLTCEASAAAGRLAKQVAVAP